MVDTKSLEQTTKNWEGAIPRVAAAYSEGIAGAQNVIQKAIAAEDNYAAGVSQAVANKSRAKGLAKISDEDWRQAALKKGAVRIGQGMTEAKGKFSSGMSEVLSVIQGVTLPARTQDPAANVDNRVKPLAVALHAMKNR